MTKNTYSSYMNSLLRINDYETKVGITTTDTQWVSVVETPTFILYSFNLVLVLSLEDSKTLDPCGPFFFP